MLALDDINTANLHNQSLLTATLTLLRLSQQQQCMSCNSLKGPDLGKGGAEGCCCGLRGGPHALSLRSRPDCPYLDLCLDSLAPPPNSKPLPVNSSPANGGCMCCGSAYCSKPFAVKLAGVASLFLAAAACSGMGTGCSGGGKLDMCGRSAGGSCCRGCSSAGPLSEAAAAAGVAVAAEAAGRLHRLAACMPCAKGVKCREGPGIPSSFP